MAKTTLLVSLALTFFALSPASLAQWEPLQPGRSGHHLTLQQIFNDCNSNRLNIDKVHLYQVSERVKGSHFSNIFGSPTARCFRTQAWCFLEWPINSHRVLYFTRGGARVLVASEKGDLVFDETLREGQLLVIPQNFVVLDAVVMYSYGVSKEEARQLKYNHPESHFFGPQ